MMRRATGSGALLLSIVISAVGCKQAAGDNCAKPDDCAVGLTCDEHTHTCNTPKEIAHQERVRKCQASDACRSEGLCDADPDGKCIASNDDDCKDAVAKKRPYRGAKLCDDLGRCHASDGRCVVKSDADCRGAEICRRLGRCGAKAGECIAVSSSDCEGTRGCQEQGSCSALDGTCKLTKQSDCAHACKQLGLCKFSKGRCIPSSADDCRKSTIACLRRGKCGLHPVFDAFPECAAVSEADCQASEGCSVSGHCGLASNFCFAKTVQHCLESKDCKAVGLCSLVKQAEANYGVCKAGSDADCKRSSMCEENGRCRAEDGFCYQ